MIKFKELIIRTLTGTLFVACVVASILFGVESFGAFIAVVAVGIMYEFCRLVNRKELRSMFIWSLIGLLLLIVVFFNRTIGIACYLLWCMLIFVRELFLQPNRSEQVSLILLGQVMVAIPLAILVEIYHSYSWELILWVFIVIWVNDTFAYLTGVLFGRHRMLERVSPKKSWEGFAGGFVFALAVCVSAAVLLAPSVKIFADYSWYVWVLMVVGIVVFGTAGDFLESLIKRRAGVKDSGDILPGHGGLFDRFDSLLMASPAIFVILLLVKYCSNLF